MILIQDTQHLYLAYHDPEEMGRVRDAYFEMDEFAAEIQQRAMGKYDRILFVSDNGAATKQEWKPTHHNRPFYSLSWRENLSNPNLRDFHDHLLRWAFTEVTVSACDVER